MVGHCPEPSGRLVDVLEQGAHRPGRRQPGAAGGQVVQPDPGQRGGERARHVLQVDERAAGRTPARTRPPRANDSTVTRRRSRASPSSGSRKFRPSPLATTSGAACGCGRARRCGQHVVRRCRRPDRAWAGRRRRTRTTGSPRPSRASWTRRPGGTLANTQPSTSRSPAAASSQRATASNRGRDAGVGRPPITFASVMSTFGRVPDQQVQLRLLGRLAARGEALLGRYGLAQPVIRYLKVAGSSGGPGSVLVVLTWPPDRRRRAPRDPRSRRVIVRTSSPRIMASVRRQVVRLHQHVTRLAALARADHARDSPAGPSAGPPWRTRPAVCAAASRSSRTGW